MFCSFLDLYVKEDPFLLSSLGYITQGHSIAFIYHQIL